MAERQHISYKFRDWQNFRHIQIPAKDEEAGMLLSDLKKEITKDRNFNEPKFKVTDFQTNREYQEGDKIKAFTKVVVELVLEEEFIEIDETVIFPSLGKDENSPAINVGSREKSVPAPSKRSSRRSSRRSSASSRSSNSGVPSNSAVPSKSGVPTTSGVPSKSGVPTTAGVSVATAPSTLDLDQEACKPLTREEEEKRITEYVEKAADEYERGVAYYINRQSDCRKCRCYRLPRYDPSKHLVKDCREGLHPSYVCQLCKRIGDHVVDNCYLPKSKADKCSSCSRGTHVAPACPFTP